LGFSFGGENALMILPQSLLSGSMLISSGSRLDRELLITLSGSLSLESVVTGLRETEALSDLRIRSVAERSERNFDTTKELTSYILLILFIAALFALIILRSAHQSLFARLAKTLSIIEILGFSRPRQIAIFALLYLMVVPLSFLLAILVSFFLFALLVQIPEAKDFVFLAEPIIFTLQMMVILVITAFSPIWIDRFGLFDRVSVYMARWRYLSFFSSRAFLTS
jgi:predicted lysophospholipase L1 biosynthesis ABC-type transport system permease subunit